MGEGRAKKKSKKGPNVKELADREKVGAVAVGSTVK